MVEEFQNNLFENNNPVILNFCFQNEPQDNFDIKEGGIYMKLSRQQGCHQEIRRANLIWLFLDDITQLLF